MYLYISHWLYSDTEWVKCCFLGNQWDSSFPLLEFVSLVGFVNVSLGIFGVVEMTI